MKHRKKRTILTLLLTLAMVFSLNITAFAAQPKAASSVTVHYYGNNNELYATETYTQSEVNKAMPAVGNLADIGCDEEEILFDRFIGWNIVDSADGGTEYSRKLYSNATAMTQEIFDGLAAAGSEFNAYASIELASERQESTLVVKFVDSSGNPLSKEAVQEIKDNFDYENGSDYITVGHESYMLFSYDELMNEYGEYVIPYYVLMPLDGSAGKLSVECDITGFDISYDPASTIDVVKGQPAKITVICKLKSAEASTGSATNATTNSANKPAAKDKVPKTGEADHLGILLAVTICGAAGMIAFGRKRQTAR